MTTQTIPGQLHHTSGITAELQTLIDDSLVGHYQRQALYDVRDYGALGDGVTDDTSAIEAAIAASVIGKGSVVIPAGDYKITSTILISDANVSIIGIGGRYKARIIKGFYGDGIRIENSYCQLRNIAIMGVLATRALDTGSGLVLGNDTGAPNITAHYADIDVFSMWHGLHGVDCQKGDQGRLRGYFNENFVDGVHCESEWVGGSADWNANILEISATGNGRHGLYIYKAEANRIEAILQGNGWGAGGGYGAVINWVGNYGRLYAEGNVTGTVQFGVNGYGNNFVIHPVDGAISYSNNANFVYNSFNSYLKNGYLETIGSVKFGIWVTGDIPGNSYTDFSINNAYGATPTGSFVLIQPNQLLPQGINYEAICSAPDTITIRVHNNTGAPVTIPNLGTQWTGIAITCA